ncbi:MAG: M15 family metallopeptidase, partial [Peptostreptococcaceae bacterium]
MKKIGILVTSGIILSSVLFLNNTDAQVNNKNNVSLNTQINYENVNEDFNITKQFKTTNKYIESYQPLEIEDIVVVNKDYVLPKDYRADKNLEKEALNAANKMMKDALEDGITIKITSGYRSFSTQKELYRRYVRIDGEEAASRYSAEAGYSEHQTGLAFDFSNENTKKTIGDWFTDTLQAKWLYENAYKYGFIIRYPEGKEHITGYQYESWHYRYVGYEHSINFAMN